MEDPATGSAAAALPGQIAAAEPLSAGIHDWLVEQGFEMGRPSIIRVSVTAAGGAPTSVRIGGNAVFVMSGQLSL
jgi:trans-2,3-dihydro-3-hydroxyanthranilate isomerase